MVKKKLRTIIFPEEESGVQLTLFEETNWVESELKSGDHRFSSVLKLTTPLTAIETKYIDTGIIKSPNKRRRLLIFEFIKIQKYFDLQKLK